MFRFIKEVLISTMAFFSCSVLSVNFLECVSLQNQEYKAGPKIISTNTREPICWCYQTKINTCSGSCGGMNDPYAKLRIPDIVKNIISKYSI